MSVVMVESSVQSRCGTPFGHRDLLTFAEGDGLAGDRRETLALEADDDRVVLARVLVDRRVLGEAELRDEEVRLADERRARRRRRTRRKEVGPNRAAGSA